PASAFSHVMQYQFHPESGHCRTAPPPWVDKNRSTPAAIADTTGHPGVRKKTANAFPTRHATGRYPCATFPARMAHQRHGPVSAFNELELWACRPGMTHENGRQFYTTRCRQLSTRSEKADQWIRKVAPCIPNDPTARHEFGPDDIATLSMHGR